MPIKTKPTTRIKPATPSWPPNLRCVLGDIASCECANLNTGTGVRIRWDILAKYGIEEIPPLPGLGASAFVCRCRKTGRRIVADTLAEAFDVVLQCELVAK